MIRDAWSPTVSVLIASDRVRTLLPECLRSLQQDASAGGPAIEVVVCSAEPPATDGLSIPDPLGAADAANPARRRNAAAARSAGPALRLPRRRRHGRAGVARVRARRLSKRPTSPGDRIPGRGDAP